MTRPAINRILDAIIAAARQLPEVGERPLVRDWRSQLRLMLDEIFVGAEDDSFVASDDESISAGAGRSDDEPSAEFTDGSTEAGSYSVYSDDGDASLDSYD